MKRFNLDEFLCFLIFLGFTIYFYYLISTGRASIFISPKMVKYMIFPLIAFGILTIYQFTKIFTIRSRQPINKSYIFLALTLVLGIFASHKGLNSGIVNKKGININTSVNVNLKDSSKANPYIFDSSGDIIFNDKNYFENIREIENNLEKYIGKKVIISGFIYKDKGFKKNEFVVARLVMSCCAADSQVIGLMSDWQKSEDLKNEEWVRVEGYISASKCKDKKSNKDIVLPILKVQKVEKIKKPQNVYVYPQ